MEEFAFTLLDWLRGPGFQIATILLCAGVALRFGEIFVIGRKANLAPPKGNAFAQGLLTIFTRSAPAPGMVRRAPAIHIAGWAFHIGFILVVLFASAHIRAFENLFQREWFWSRIPGDIIAPITLVAILAMVVLLVTRAAHPVRRKISTFGDYGVWVLTFTPLITGFLSAHDLTNAPVLMKLLHVLSAELLMVAFPFTKLMHGFSTLSARYYNGAIQGYKGAKS